MYSGVETYRGTVFPWECDWNGHMNVRFYVGKFDEGTWQLMAALGASRDELKRRRMGAMAVSQTIQYRRELHPGDTVAVRSTVREIGRSSCRFRHRMIETASGDVAAEMEIVGVFVDLDSRQAKAIWPELRSRAEALKDAAG